MVDVTWMHMPNYISVVFAEKNAILEGDSLEDKNKITVLQEKPESKVKETPN